MKTIISNTFLIFFLLMTIVPRVFSQHNENLSTHDLSNGHDEETHFRIAVLIGHTLIRSEGTNSHLFIPSWGVDLEYWFTHKWGIGFHNDIEIETFIIRQSDQEEIERINPLVVTLDLLYRSSNGWVFSLGPGTEYEHGESFYLARFGIEYEKEIGNGYDIFPSFFYDQRLDGFATYTVALGVGKRF